MPGPKMGARPVDFDEDIVRQSPTFIRWTTLQEGDKLRYACRDFIKGHGDDEERLMRRIMIARRNNLRDHETLKRARQTLVVKQQQPPPVVKESKRRVTSGLSDSQVANEMDVPAVEGTRSYRSWMALDDGKEFVYNQKYVKGKEGHDWLLRKNIWRRMRYRRENKKMVEKLKGDDDDDDDDEENGDEENEQQQQHQQNQQDLSAAAGIVDHALLSAAAEGDFVNKAVVDAAVAAAESYVKEAEAMAAADEMRVHNPLDAAASNEALDAAAKLAAASAPLEHDDDDEEEDEDEGQVEGHDEEENDATASHIKEEHATKEESPVKEEHDSKEESPPKEEPEMSYAQI